MFPKCAGSGVQVTGFESKVGSLCGIGLPTRLGSDAGTGLESNSGLVAGTGFPFRKSPERTKPSGIMTFQEIGGQDEIRTRISALQGPESPIDVLAHINGWDGAGFEPAMY